MTYANGRTIIDVDSHLMDWPGFVTDHADPSVRERIPTIGGGRGALDLTAGAHADDEPGVADAFLAGNAAEWRGLETRR